MIELVTAYDIARQKIRAEGYSSPMPSSLDVLCELRRLRVVASQTCVLENCAALNLRLADAHTEESRARRDIRVAL